MIHEMETVNMQSWRAIKTHYYAGWTIRVSGGYSRRGNSVFTHQFDDTESVDTAIECCETIYNKQDLPVIFRLTDATRPENLGETLENWGYKKEEPSIVKTLDLTQELPDAHENVTVETRFSDTWLQDYMQFNNVDPKLFESHKGIISPMPDCYYGRIGDAALGLAVKVGDWVSFYDIVVNPEKRGEGYGRFLMQSLMKQAQSTGAKTGILSVGSDNPAAIKLYDNLGFESRYNYWYYRQQRK